MKIVLDQIFLFNFCIVKVVNIQYHFLDLISLYYLIVYYICLNILQKDNDRLLFSRR